MKKLLISILVFTWFSGKAQVLVETLEGDEISLNLNGLQTTTLLGNVNTSEQSVQFKSLLAFKNPMGVTTTSFMTIGIKGKPSDGIATLFSGGNFNPGVNLNLGYTKVGLLFKQTPNVVDIVSVKIDYNVNKYTLFHKDSTADKQIHNFTFHGGGLTLHYNTLIQGKHLLTFAVGYSRNNNYQKLESVELKKYQTVIDSSTQTIKEYGQTVNGRTGTYKEFNSFPLRIGYVYCPSLYIGDVKKLKVGFAAYYSTEFGKKVPLHNLGAQVFLTKQNATSGIRVPIIGLGVQVNDFTDNLNTNTSFGKKITFNLSTTFSVFSL